MPSPRFPLWWIPVFAIFYVPAWWFGASAVTLFWCFVLACGAYGVGWHFGVRAIRLVVVDEMPPDKQYPPDDCPYDHDVKKLLTIGPGMEVRCNACGILIGKGMDF